DNFLPVLRLEIGNGCGHQAEIAAGIVDTYIKVVAVVVDVVLGVGSAFPYQPPATVGPIGRQVTYLARSVAVARKQQVNPPAGQGDMDPEALVFFLVHQPIPPLPPAMPPELVWTLA